MPDHIRRGLVAGAFISLLPAAVRAGQTTRFVFAWSHDHQGNVYVSHSSMSVDYRDYSAALRRWNAIILQTFDPDELQNRTAGTPGNIYYSSAEQAESARRQFMARERQYGKNVIEYEW